MDTASVVGGWCASAPPMAPPVRRPAGTLTIPLPLTHDVGDVPHALGIYVLVVRLYAIHQRPLPLSASDLQTYDPQLTYGQARRALQRLVRTRWLIPQQIPGHKAAYLPTWGQGRAWDSQAPRAWGRPRRLRTLPVDTRLLDTCMGTLTPHPLQPARRRSYLSTPLLSLHDVGCYVLTLAGVPTPTDALRHYGLIAEQQACPLPPTEVLLCQGSQPRSAPHPSADLTVAGMQRLGVACTPPPAADPRPHVFFVPLELAGSMHGPPTATRIGQKPATDAPSMPAVRHETPIAPAPVRAPWTQTKKQKRTTPEAGSGARGGGAVVGAPDRLETADPVTQRLQAIGVRPQLYPAFATLDPGLVAAIIAYAEGCSGIHSLPGLVVSLLRDAHTHGWRPPTPTTPFLADTEKYTTGAYAGCFQIHRPSADGLPPLPPSPMPPVDPAAPAPLPDQAHLLVGSSAPLPPAAPVAAAAVPARWVPPDNAAIWRTVQAALELQMTRQQYADGVGAASLVEIAGATVVLRVPTPAAHEQLGVRWRSALARAFDVQLGYPVQLRLVLGP